MPIICLWYKSECNDTRLLCEFHTTSLSKVIKTLPAANKHFEVAAVAAAAAAAAAAAEELDANEVAAISNLPVVTAGGLYAAVVVAEGGPDPLGLQTHFQVSVLL